MPEAERTYIVECYLPGVTATDAAEAGQRAGRAAEALSAGGASIAYLGGTYVEADEAVFHSFRASDVAVVAEASRAAGLAFERVVEAIEVAGERPAIGRGTNLVTGGHAG